MLPPENDFVNCSGCKGDYDYVCAGIRESSWRKYSVEAKLAWRCFICKTKTSCADNTRSDQSNSLSVDRQGCTRSTAADSIAGEIEVAKTTVGFDELGYMRELLRHKDVIIDNQADLIRSLKEQITLLKSETTSTAASIYPHKQPSDGTPVHAVPRASQTQPRVPHSQQATDSPGGKHTGRVHRVERCTDGAGVSKLDVQEAVAKARMRNVISLTEEPKAVVNELGTGRRRTIIGGRTNDADCKLRAAEALSLWHVYWLHPDTTEKDLTDYLGDKFTMVRVERLKSANPDTYASFKITVREDEGPRVADASLWPSGTRIRRFFLRKNK